MPRMVDWLLQSQKKNLIYCPELVDHYNFISFFNCFFVLFIVPSGNGRGAL